MNDLVVTVSCPACGYKKASSLLFQSRQKFATFDICQCDLCSHRFVIDPPGAEELGKLYDDTYEIDERNNKKSKPIPRDRALVRTLTPHLPKNARVLDIGANFGGTLLAFPSGYHLEGIELSKPAAETAARNKRLIIHNDFLENIDLPQASYDCIISLAVIEHVLNTKAYLETIKKLLAPGGIAVLMTGDWRTWSAKEKGSSWHLYHCDGHLHFFSALSLELALHRAGLAVRKRLWAGPNPVTSRLPALLARVLHCQTTSIRVPFMFAQKALGDQIYLWVEHEKNDV